MNNEELAMLIQKGINVDKNFEKLVENNKKFLLKKTRQFLGATVEYHDVYNNMVIALFKSCLLYNPDKGFKLLTYMTRTSQQVMSYFKSENTIFSRHEAEVKSKIIAVLGDINVIYSMPEEELLQRIEYKADKNNVFIIHSLQRKVKSDLIYCNKYDDYEDKFIEFIDKYNLEQDVEHRELICRIKEIIEENKEDKKIKILVRFINGSTYDELEKETGLKKTVLVSRVHRAKDFIRKKLKKENLI